MSLPMPKSCRLLMLILAMGLLSCRSSHVVRGDGLKHIRLGAPMPTPTNQQLRRVPTRDSLMREGGYEIGRAHV